MLTNNKILVENIRPTKTIFCIQRNAEKVVPTEDILIKSNIASFGDDIGKTTNKVTAMYDVQAVYEPGSPEYETLEYRIMSGQLFQQNAIDRIKGIICNPMPRSWYDYHANALPEDATEEQAAEREFNLSIIAEKKPYFMRYIYPTLMHQYNTYIKNANTKCIREFRMDVPELLAIPAEDRTPEQESFITYYKRRLPVGENNCVMNRICRRFEEEFDGKLKSFCDDSFDYTILKSDEEYTSAQFTKFKKLYAQYTEWLMEISAQRRTDRFTDSADDGATIRKTWFRRNCREICSDARVMCNILLDMCYRREGTKKFAWDMCDYEIVGNLAARNGGIISYPTADPNGDIEFAGMRFSMTQARYTSDDTREEDAFERDNPGREGMGEERD